MPSSSPVGLSFVTPIAFDYRYAFDAIISYYEIAEEIILGLDADRLTWSGKPFEIDVPELENFIREIDRAGKIRVVEDNFHREDHPMANETGERSMLSTHCRPGNWVVQIDCDEILLNPDEFRQWMMRADQAADVVASWVTVFKTFGREALVVMPQSEIVVVATMQRASYTIARATARPARLSPLQMLHFSYGRSPGELRQKLANWGHARDFDTDQFFQMWESVTLENYREFRNFHPIVPTKWEQLQRVTIDRTDHRAG